MRLRIVLGLFTVALLICLMSPDGYGQGKGKGRFGADPGAAPDVQPGGGKKSGFDPSKIFDFIAKGKPAIVIAEMSAGLKDSLAQFAQAKGITNGEITREQWADYVDYTKARQAAGLSIIPKATPQPGAAPGAPGAPAEGASQELMQLWADTDFKRLDENGDGKLNQDEMPGALRNDLAKWDKNGDGLIDQAEYRNYFVTRLQERMAGNSPGMQPPGPGGFGAPPEDELDKRPVVFRAGKLPAQGLPPWFKLLDTDNDGQVALYEWRQAGRDLSEFKQWDRDDDGFITPEEAMHVYAVMTRTADPLLASANATPGAFPGGQFGGQFQGMGMRMPGGKGQFGGFGGQVGQFGQFGGQVGQFGQFGGGKGQFGGGKGQFGGQGGQFGGTAAPGQFPPFGGGGRQGGAQPGSTPGQGQFGGFNPGAGQMGVIPGGGQFGGKKGGKKGGGNTPPNDGD